MSEYRRLPRDPAVGDQNWLWEVANDEYRYDALGRRVLVRTRRTCRDAINYGGTDVLCGFSTLRRTVWEGAEELYEIQMRDHGAEGPPLVGAEADTALFIPPPTFPNFWDPNRKLGRVAYLHGPGLDQPLSVTRLNFTDYPNGGPQVNWAPLTVVPHWNWRGQADYGTMGDGGWKTCQASPPTRCVSVAYSHKRLAYVNQAADTGSGWWGTLLDLKEDGTGTYYRRNRYLDPATGRFTQEDPIGLAGGLNLYGFAAGDPVNFSDPFGLCPEEKRDKDGKCPGGLTVREWQNVENAAKKHLREVARKRILDALNAGQIRGGNLGGADAGVSPFSPHVIRLNRELKAFDRRLSAFDWDPENLARILAHEDRHVQTLEGVGFPRRFVGAFWGGEYGRILQADADSYAAANLVP